MLGDRGKDKYLNTFLRIILFSSSGENIQRFFSVSTDSLVREIIHDNCAIKYVSEIFGS